MAEDALFDLEPDDLAPRPAARPAPRLGRKRLRHAVRNQVEFRASTLDELLPDDHPARILWEYVDSLDLSELHERVQAVAGGPGQAPADPRILLTLWMYATVRGVGSARELDRLCAEHAAFRWICGGVSMNYHTLADFRTDHEELLDRLLTQSVAGLMSEGLVTLEQVAQDGMRVRASAGASSFRRQPTLEEALAEAEAHLAALKAEGENDSAGGSRRRQAARRRAAEERTERIQAALAKIPEFAESKKPQDREQTRGSTTDADARVMKMANGGFRPAYNVQLATTVDSRIITGLDVTTAGGDRGELAPMMDQHEERYGCRPEAALVDGGYVKNEGIEQVEQAGTTVYAPVQKSKNPQRDPHTPREQDTPGVAAWRQRMGTEVAKQVYRLRAATAEWINAQFRNRGLRQFNVRGLRKVRTVTLWYAVAHNALQAAALRAERAAEAMQAA